MGTRKNRVKVDFASMPEYTKPECYRARKYVRETGLSAGYEFDDEEDQWKRDVFGIDPWGFGDR